MQESNRIRNSTKPQRMRKKKGKKKGFHLGSKLGLSLNILVVLTLLLSYLAPYAAPKAFWPLAFLGIAYPLLLGLNILFIGYWTIKKSLYALLSLSAILVGCNPLLKHIGFHSKPSEEYIKNPDSSTVRILSYNVHLFRQYDWDTEPKMKDEITALIQSVSPDIVCMQEFYTRKKGRYNIRQSLSSTLKLPYSYFYPVIENEYEAYGLLILSRFPIKNAGIIPTYNKKRTLNHVIYADIFNKKQAFRVYNVHLQSIGFEPQDYAFVKAVQQRNFEQDNMASTKRIGSRLKAAFLERGEQARQLKEEIDRCRKPVIITGDFNDTPLSYAVNTVANHLNNSFREKGRGWGITYNGDFPNFQIDYILSSKNFKVKAYQILNKKISDHYAIWSDLSL